MNQLSFTVYTKPIPQGSHKGFVVNGRAIVTGANSKTKPFRGEVTMAAMAAMEKAGMDRLLAEKHQPVSLTVGFFFSRPSSCPKKRREMVVKPDLDKLVRATKDAMTGVVYHDDGQVTTISASKQYGSPERVEVTVLVMDVK